MSFGDGVGKLTSSVISSSGASAAYAADILAILDLYFKKPLGPLPSIVLLLTTQCVGFGLAGELPGTRSS